MRHKEIMMALQTRQIGLTTTVSGVEGEGGGQNIKTLKGIYLCPRKKEGFFIKHIYWGGEH